MDFSVPDEMEAFSNMPLPGPDFDYNGHINSVSDSLAASPLNITDVGIFNSFEQLIAYLPQIADDNSKTRTLIYSTLTKSFQAEIETLQHEGLEANASDHKQVLYSYCFLVYISIKHLIELFEAPEKKRKTSKTSARDEEEDRKKAQMYGSILSSILLNLCALMEQQLTSIFQGEQETIQFCDIVLKSSSAILLSKESMREKANRNLLVKLVCIVAKYHQQNKQVSSRLVIAIPFSEHLAEPIAEILSRSVETYDNRNLLQEVMKEVADVPDMGTNMARVVGPFIITLAENLKADIVNYFSYFQRFATLTQTVRAAAMICYGHCINSLSGSRELLCEHQEIVKTIMETFENRLLDVYQIVRQRVFQALELIIDSPNTEFDFKDHRHNWTNLAIRHLEDKSSFVRKSALTFLEKIIEKHPFTLNGGKLEWSFFWNAYVEFTKMLKESDKGFTYNITIVKERREEEYYNKLLEIQNEPEHKATFEQVLGAVTHLNDDDEESSEWTVPPETHELILKRQLAQDACIFILQLNKSFELAGNLLNSKNKSDTISAIDYFVLGDAYNITAAKFGIKQMLHLIWTSGASEDGNKVIEKLTDSYIYMFLKPDPYVSESLKKVYIATSLIKLTYNCSMADLISLEKLVVEIYKGKLVDASKKEKEDKDYIPQRKYCITPGVINALWNSFINSKYIKEKRGAIIILGMLASANNKIMYDKIDWLIEYGLQIDNNDIDYQITSFTCVALRRTIPIEPPKSFVYPNFKTSIEQMKKILLLDTNNGDWFNLAEEAMNTLYEIDTNVDESVTDVLKEKALELFGDGSTEQGNDKKSDSDRTIELSQLLFMLGHVALKTIIFLEKYEADFKRKKTTDDKKNEHDVELDMIGGTNEDDFSDAVQNIKEKELLYGPNSILAKFLPLVVEIIKKPKKYKNEILQRQATLCFAKFMCVSPKFCEENLTLYLAIMKKSRDNVVRSNMVLGLGDVAVCFGNVIDENRSALYSLLQDKDLTVQRTCLMTVIFLILAGQIKVKGQFAQLAKLVVHEDKGLNEMSKLFFQELATKDNALYNGFIEMLSGLNLYVDDVNPAIEPFPFDKFKGVIRFVLQYIGKDKQRYLLIKKLHARLKLCTPNERIRFIFCIKEILRRDETALRKDVDTERSKYYKLVLDDIAKLEKTITA